MQGRTYRSSEAFRMALTRMRVVDGNHKLIEGIIVPSSVERFIHAADMKYTQ